MDNNQKNADLQNEVDTSKIKDKDIRIELNYKVIITMALFGAAFFATSFFSGQPMVFWIPSIFIGILFGYISAVDIKLHLCPDWASFAVLGFALPQVIYYTLTSNWFMLISMALGLVVGALPLLLGAIFSKGGMGGADIKIMGATGLFLGIDKTFVALIIGLALSIIGYLVLRIMKKADKNAKLALLPYLCCGCIISPLLFII